MGAGGEEGAGAGGEEGAGESNADSTAFSWLLENPMSLSLVSIASSIGTSLGSCALCGESAPCGESALCCESAPCGESAHHRLCKSGSDSSKTTPHQKYLAREYKASIHS